MKRSFESFSRPIPVLTYHHVSPAGGPLSISAACFDSQMKWLANNGYVTLTADEFASYLHGERMPDKSILLTFDDGYLDNYLHAHPILNRYGHNALMFLVTERIHDGPARSLAERHAHTTPTHEECERLIETGRADDVTVRWSEIEAMRAAGTFEFHSHTHSHRRWDLSCNDAGSKRAMIGADIETAKSILSERLGTESKHLCWPEGYYDADYIGAALDAGYEYLYTTRNVRLNAPGSDRHQIQRMVDNGKGDEWLERKLWRYRHPVWGPAYYGIKQLKSAVRGAVGT